MHFPLISTFFYFVVFPIHLFVLLVISILLHFFSGSFSDIYLFYCCFFSFSNSLFLLLHFLFSLCIWIPLSLSPPFRLFLLSFSCQSPFVFLLSLPPLCCFSVFPPSFPSPFPLSSPSAAGYWPILEFHVDRQNKRVKFLRVLQRAFGRWLQLLWSLKVRWDIAPFRGPVAVCVCMCVYLSLFFILFEPLRDF